MAERYIFTVSELNQFIKDLLDNVPPLTDLLLRGEISNYKVYPSGHHYFTLKDSQCAVKCVLFKGSAMKLRFRPENGMQVIASGRISVYPRDGAYQLYCTGLSPDGAGDLSVAYEQLKEKLRLEGLFDEAHKKPLPPYPQRIAIVTSPAGAAVHDMIRILRRRYPIAKVLLLPVRVQGTEAPAEIAGAIRYANRHRLADVLITGRGGGSLEDLWAFNDEWVARAIYDSEIPVISAVGHEPDVAISDFVADRRASTPSNAAEIAVPDREAALVGRRGQPHGPGRNAAAQSIPRAAGQPGTEAGADRSHGTDRRQGDAAGSFTAQAGCRHAGGDRPGERPVRGAGGIAGRAESPAGAGSGLCVGADGGRNSAAFGGTDGGRRAHPRAAGPGTAGMRCGGNKGGITRWRQKRRLRRIWPVWSRS